MNGEDNEAPRPRQRAIDDDALVVMLEQANRTAIGYMSDEVSQDQDDNLDRYLGKPYGDEEEGSSNAVSMDVAEVVDWALPDLLEPFISGERVVEFQPKKRADEEWTEQASDFANYVFYEDNPGVTILYDVAKTALIQKIGVIKTVWVKESKTERKTFSGISIITVNEMRNDDDLTVIEVTSEPLEEGMVDEQVQSAFTDGQVYTITVEHMRDDGYVKLMSIPPEQFKVSQRAADLKSATYCAHEVEVRRADLLDMGYDRSLVNSLKDHRQRESDRSDHRFFDEERVDNESYAKAHDILTLIEEYMSVDLYGDGRPVMVQAMRVGKQLLGEPMQVDEHPFDAWSPDRIPNRLIGLSLADKVKQTQYIKTALTRNMLDNVYLANNPRFEVPDGAASDNTIEDLLTYRVGGLIRTKGEGGQVRPIEVPDRSDTALRAITYMDTVREMQSGIVRNGMAISSETIDPKSATEARSQDRNEQVRKRLMCRMFAEGLLVPVFKKILKLLIKYQDYERDVRVRGKWVSMDPRLWNAECAATCSVGLGHANRDEEMGAANIILQVQQAARDAGMMIGPQHFFEAAKVLVRAAGLKYPEKFFPDPSSPEVQQAMQQAAEQPNPELAKVQAKQQADTAALQAKSQLQAAEMQFRQQVEAMKIRQAEQERVANQAFEMRKQAAEMQARLAFDREQAAADLQLELRKMEAERASQLLKIQTEAALARERMAAEMSLAEEKIRMEGDIARQAIRAKGGNGSNGLSGSVRFGGNVG